jgi:hypothetical protein
MMRVVRALALAAALVGLGAGAALADPAGADIGLTLNPVLGGVHDSFDDTIHLPPVPVPLLDVSAHAGPLELVTFGLPVTAAVPYTDAIQGAVALRLTIVDATLRVWGGRFGVGVGQTLYNQTTHYATADSYATSGDERQYSRITGAHYEIAMRMPFRAGTLETSLRDAPVLLGTQVSTYGNGTPSRFDPERGEQIDGSIRYKHQIGPHEDAELGVRYVNFTAAYDIPSRPLSDRNCALMPSIGYLWRP